MNNRLLVVALSLQLLVVMMLVYCASDDDPLRFSLFKKANATHVKHPVSSFLGFVRGHDERLHRGVVLLGVTNYAMRHVALNFLVSLRNVGGVDPRSPVVVCLDVASFEFLRDRGVNVYLADAAMWQEVGWELPPWPISGRETNVGMLGYGKNRDYVHLVRCKAPIVRYLLRHGLNVLLFDVDIVLLRSSPNAIDAVIDRLEQSSDVDVLMQSNRPERLVYNTGFYVCRSSPRSIELFDAFVDRLGTADAADLAIDDQTIFNRLVLKERPDQLARLVDQLPYDQFPSGIETVSKNPMSAKCCSPASGLVANMKRLWKAGWPTTQDDQKPFLVHFNFIRGDDKVTQMKAWGANENTSFTGSVKYP